MNNIKQRISALGVTLIEVLLVMVVISAVILMSIGYMQQRTLQLQVDKTVTTAQQILSAGLAYYVVNSSWPDSLACLQGSGGGLCTVPYLPTVYNPFAPGFSTNLYFAQPASVVWGNNNPNFAIDIPIFMGTQTYAITEMVAGRLPLSSIVGGGGFGTPCAPTDSLCFVIAEVTIPGQNLNNLGNFNFGGVYHNGACVPVPVCPTDPGTGTAMQAEILVTPAAVTGANTAPGGTPSATCNATDTSGCTVEAYPLTSFTAKAVGPEDVSIANPGSCADPNTPEPCYAGYNSADASTGTLASPASGKYWRVCLAVVTEAGTVSPSSIEQGLISGTVMAITRCVPPGQQTPGNEKTGSSFSVWAP